MNKKDKLITVTKWELAIIICLTGFVILIPLIVFSDNIDLDYLKKIAEVGNNLAGLLIPFLTLGGSILVYLAFKSQIKANTEIQKQFSIQNEEQHFFRLVDSLEKKVSSFRIPESVLGQEYQGYSILHYFQQAIRAKNEQIKEIATSTIIFDYPEKLLDEHYKLIFDAIISSTYLSVEEFKEHFLAGSRTDKIRTLENDFHSQEVYFGGNDMLKIAYEKIHYDLVYEMPYKYYKYYYEELTKKLYNDYGVFFDAYFKTVNMIFEFVNLSTKKDFFIRFLKNNFSNYEKVIIFLLIATERSSEDTKELVKEYKFLDDLKRVQGIRLVNMHEKYDKHLNFIIENAPCLIK